MNLAYLEFIGAIDIDRSTPTFKEEKDENENITVYSYLDEYKIRYTIEELNKALEQAKKDQRKAIKYIYNEIVEIVNKTNSQLKKGYIMKNIEKTNRPRYVINDKNMRKGTDDFANGDVMFTEDEIILLVDSFTIELLDALRDKYSKDIKVTNGILTKDPIEIHIDMSYCLSK